MGRLLLAPVECNYKEVDTQLKEQFIHRLNDNDMLAEIFREPTKAEESATITSEQVLGRANRVEAQRAHSAVMASSTKQELDKVKTVKGGPRYNGRNAPTNAEVSAKQRGSYCGSSHPPRQCLPMGESVQTVARSITSEKSAEAGEIQLSIT